MTWQEGATESIGLTLSGRFPKQEEAAKVQVKLCMTFLLETFRAADTKQESSIRDLLPAIRNLKKAHALDQEFQRLAGVHLRGGCLGRRECVGRWRLN